MQPWWAGRCQSSSCDARCNACRRNWITGLTSAASPRLHISSTCKVGQKLGEILYLLICSFLLCLFWLLRSRVRKSRRDLWITLYIDCKHKHIMNNMMVIKECVDINVFPYLLWLLLLWLICLVFAIWSLDDLSIEMLFSTKRKR